MYKVLVFEKVIYIGILMIFGIGFEVMLYVVIMDFKMYVKYLIMDYVM